MHAPNDSSAQFSSALNFLNLMKATRMLREINSNQTKTSFVHRILKSEQEQIEFLNLKTQQVLKSKLKSKQKADENVHDEKKVKKATKKQTTLTKTRGKLEKPKIKENITKLSSLPVKSTTDNGNISIKMLLNDQISKKRNKSSNQWQTKDEIRTYRSSLQLRSDKIGITPPKSLRNLKEDQMSISPADEFDNSQQIQIVKHANHFQAFIKNNDVIDRMEALKAKHKTKVERQKHVGKLREKNPKEQNVSPTKLEKKQEPGISDLFFRSVGNKYMRIIVQNYSGENRAFLK